METKDLRKLKSLFNKAKKACIAHAVAGTELDREIDKVFGFHPSETNDDEIIDTLDYGTSAISFETFMRKMKGYQSQREDPFFTRYTPEF